MTASGAGSPAAGGAAAGGPGAGGPGRATRYERSARFWLRAYPRRWRERHGEEALAVLLDLEPPRAVPDGARPVPGIGAREAWGLVRAGWALRRREHPPLGRWLLYRVFDARLPARYWWWVADDIHGALYPWRVTATSLGTAVAVLYGWPVLGHVLFALDVSSPAGWLVVVWVVAFALGGIVFRRSHVERAWRKHVLDGHIPVDPPRSAGA
ncbi:hypothetical protein [Cellulosimicrobium protaetiae]|uniref:Uncharacterized protein n=1 Tax=Cellulosimicrobium protaetiae TaxID=2587808 RepID=A0A6M5UH38_9MICO|nr:hypothetical protein [Cellulosimicrobium protaetiae]QJW37947.1 hypothetical protein FIC82_018995 [Cellulosimicrobium protaetiae]